MTTPVRMAAAALALATAITACGAREPPAPARLPAVGIAPGSVTVSGISGGGYMAVQFHVAHSGLVHGAGVVAAGPYYCAEASLRLALGRCMSGGEPIPTEELVSTTSRLALEEAIDPIANLADDRVWLFHGAADPTIAKPVVDALDPTTFGMPPASMANGRAKCKSATRTAKPTRTRAPSPSRTITVC